MGTKKYNRKHIGEQITTTEGYSELIVDGGSKLGYCTVHIHGVTWEVRYNHAKSSKIKHPMHPSVYSTGYIGIGVHTSTINNKHTVCYNTWNSMLRRCYSKLELQRFPTYNAVTVCREWHNFQVFADWFYSSNYQHGWQLDKDLLSGQRKVYSPETCLFIPAELNTLLTNKQRNNTSGFTGVSYDKTKNKWITQICMYGSLYHLGYFDAPSEASLVYQEARKSYIIQLKKKYSKSLPTSAIRLLK